MEGINLTNHGLETCCIQLVPESLQLFFFILNNEQLNGHLSIPGIYHGNCNKFKFADAGLISLRCIRCNNLSFGELGGFLSVAIFCGMTGCGVAACGRTGGGKAVGGTTGCGRTCGRTSGTPG